MSTKTLLSAIAACFVLSGCPHPYQRPLITDFVKAPNKGECRGDNTEGCRVNVYVDGNTVRVDKELLLINNGKKDNEITWILVERNGIFDDQKGIVFLDDHPDEDRKQFKCSRKSDYEWRCKNKHDNKEVAVYKYIIFVKDKSPLDPWVVND